MVMLIMKHAIPILMAIILLLLTACGAPAAQPSATPAEVEASSTPAATPSPEPLPEISPQLPPSGYPRPEFVAGPAEGGYTFRSEELGFSFTVPAEVSHKVAVSAGVEYWDPDGPSFTVYYVPENGRYPLVFYYIVAESPRSNYFSPDTWYYSNSTHTIIAMSENSIYFSSGQIGGSETSVVDPLFEDYCQTGQILYPSIRSSFTMDTPSSVPELNTAALPEKADKLAAKGAVTITRAEAAQLAFDLLTAENKDKEYPLNYTDVDANSEYAHAIAYLDSYGLLTRYSRDGENLDSELFRPEEPITRAEFTMFLHRLSFQTSPMWYGDILETLSTEYWGFFYMNYAWKCGWLEVDDSGDIRPDEPITAAEAAQALSVVAEIGYPTPGVDF